VGQAWPPKATLAHNQNMLIQIGPSREPSDIVDLLLECHERIRTFLSLANRLAHAHAASRDEISDAATRITRYFSDALPLHVADEEQSILPRLSGRTPELDAALEGMHQEHLDHEPQLNTLVELCHKLQTSPERLEELRHSLLSTASMLGNTFSTHLEQEEQIILPAIKTCLPPLEQAAMLSELRARRNAHH
jgi:iron-sulfur cluster repair protein YtfE (RIC family)